MKRFSVLFLSLVLTVCMFSACAKDYSGDITYDKKADYDILRPADVKVKFSGGKITKVTLSSMTLTSDEYSHSGGVLSIGKSVFKDAEPGVKVLRVYSGGEVYVIDLRVFSATIYTPQDFNLVRTDPTGSFRLGADIDFSGIPFEPIGRAKNKPFDGVFDGQGYSLKNIHIYEQKSAVDSDGNKIWPQNNSANFNNGIFYSIAGNGVVENTNFLNVTLQTMGLSGAVAGTNGGIIRNCFVTANMHTGFGGEDSYYERGAGIAGVNGTGDAAGLIENCVVIARWDGGTPFQYRLYADWNVGTIRNCRAATYNDDFKTMNLNTINLKSDWYNDAALINWALEEHHLTGDNYDGDAYAGKFDNDFILPALGGNMADNLVTVNGQIITTDGKEPTYCGHGEDGKGALLNGTYIDATPKAETESCGCPKYNYKVFFNGGSIENAYILKMSMMTDQSNFEDFDTELWEIRDGSVPMLKVAN